MSEINQTSSPTPQQLEARERMKALLGVTDEELDARILKIAQAIKAAQPNAMRSTVSFNDTRKYYRVVHDLFETIVDARDAATPELAKIEAFSNPKQSWYYHGSIPTYEDYNRSFLVSVEEWDHNKFVDWLRR